MTGENKTRDVYNNIGLEFGRYLNDQFGSLRVQTVSVVDVDDNYAYVVVYDDDTPLSVPLSFMNVENATLKVKPQIGSTISVAFLNGDEANPFIVDAAQVANYTIGRGDSELSLTLDPDDAANDVLYVKIGTSTLRVAPDVIEFNGGGLNGLVVLNELTDKLNELVSTFNNHIHQIPPGTFLISATAGVVNPTPEDTTVPTSDAAEFNSTDYENPKITQG